MTWARVPCQEWRHGLHKAGYGQRQYKGKNWLAHRAAWDEEIGPIPDGEQVLHRCDNRPCVEVQHLFLGTLADNMADMVSKGRQSRGSKHPPSKLTEGAVISIRNEYSRGSSQTELARRYGVHQSRISLIVRRKAWAHV